MNKFLEHKILSEIKLKFPQYDWIENPAQIEHGEDNFVLDTSTLLELEHTSDIIIYNLNVEPEVEYSFESEEEAFCQVYTDEKGNIRSMWLDID